MKFCPVVPEICRGHVHVAKKERRIIIIIIIIIIISSKEVRVTIESYGKVEISYINVDNF
jgi:hypothetical protein